MEVSADVGGDIEHVSTDGTQASLEQQGSFGLHTQV